MAPSRKQTKGPDIEGSRAIASGALAGFAGFLDESFREHDFFLGRKNCQRFLQRYFTAPMEQFFHPDICTKAAKARYEVIINDRQGERSSGQMPFIPDLGTNGEIATPEEPLPFPSFKIERLEIYKKPLLYRLQQLILLSLKPNYKQKALFLVGVILTLPFSPIILFSTYLWLRSNIWRKLKNATSSQLRDWQLCS